MSGAAGPEGAKALGARAVAVLVAAPVLVALALLGGSAGRSAAAVPAPAHRAAVVDEAAQRPAHAIPERRIKVRPPHALPASAGTHLPLAVFAAAVIALLPLLRPGLAALRFPVPGQPSRLPAARAPPARAI